MIKARFSEQQQPVKVTESEDRYYIFICLNEEKMTEDTGDGQGTETYYEYDYNEIVEDKDAIDIVDVKSHPENYLSYMPPEELETLREEKLNEISNQCEQVIYNGVDVDMASGKQHFSLTEKDQLNIFGLQAKITAGQTSLEYHADGQPCTYYDVSDIQKLISAAMSFVSYHTTYCNSLNMWIKNETDASTISSIYYGIDIPEKYQSEVFKYYLKELDK